MRHDNFSSAKGVCLIGNIFSTRVWEIRYSARTLTPRNVSKEKMRTSFSIGVRTTDPMITYLATASMQMLQREEGLTS